MPSKRITPGNIKGILIQHAIHGVGSTFISRSFRVARSTVHKYIQLYKTSGLAYIDVVNLSAKKIATIIYPAKNIYKSGHLQLRSEGDALFLLKIER